MGAGCRAEEVEGVLQASAPFFEGGREAVGGSPRGVVVPAELLEAVLTTLEDSLLTKEVI